MKASHPEHDLFHSEAAYLQNGPSMHSIGAWLSWSLPSVHKQRSVTSHLVFATVEWSAIPAAHMHIFESVNVWMSADAPLFTFSYDDDLYDLSLTNYSQGLSIVLQQSQHSKLKAPCKSHSCIALLPFRAGCIASHRVVFQLCRVAIAANRYYTNHVIFEPRCYSQLHTLIHPRCDHSQTLVY